MLTSQNVIIYDCRSETNTTSIRKIYTALFHKWYKVYPQYIVSTRGLSLATEADLQINHYVSTPLNYILYSAEQVDGMCIVSDFSFRDPYGSSTFEFLNQHPNCLGVQVLPLAQNTIHHANVCTYLQTDTVDLFIRGRWNEVYLPIRKDYVIIKDGDFSAIRLPKDVLCISGPLSKFYGIARGLFGKNLILLSESNEDQHMLNDADYFLDLSTIPDPQEALDAILEL